jgi:uncharacterized protein (DUF2267 family)
MEELIKQVMKKVGLSEDLAKKAVETVLGFLKDKLPQPIAGQVDALLGGGDVAGQAGELLEGLSGLLGGGEE